MINPNVSLMNNLLVLYVEDGKSTIDLSEITAPNLVALTRVNFNAAYIPSWIYADMFNKIKMEAKFELARRYVVLLDTQASLKMEGYEHV